MLIAMMEVVVNEDDTSHVVVGGVPRGYMGIPLPGHEYRGLGSKREDPEGDESRTIVSPQHWVPRKAHMGTRQ